MTPIPAPDFPLIDPDGKAFQLASCWSRTPALLVFYPGDDTPVCTRQLCEYRDRWADFSALGVPVIGINPAGHQRHRVFIARHHFPFTILSDPGGVCCAAYGARAWYGTRRVVVLVDAAGMQRWRKSTWPMLRPRAEELIEAVKTHGR
jgi:peroxiredoxin Q/BCP